MNFEIVKYLDKTSKEIEEILWDIEFKTNFSKDSCVVVFVSSHGQKEKIFGIDSEYVYTNNFFNAFNKNQTLSNKPKLFFIDTCRGNNEFEIESIKKNTNLVDLNLFCIDHFKHNLIAYSTIENFMSYMSNNGSIFIKNICNEINKYEDDDISSILRNVNNEIAKETQNKQLSEFQDRFLANFYFQPKNEKKDKNKIHI
ncbi:unnamed protein product [Brachionus calyciflorus]|uniref:Caspase family p20 domain-containing protein n=1 Tax=Brachionus calyciflorus TaxID=104777 RepID=A0A814R5H3_9BILA|nr:unnamed protein product [Brachionus calyciflorus]